MKLQGYFYNFVLFLNFCPQIVECNALPTLILMLRSDDAAIHYEAVRFYNPYNFPLSLPMKRGSE